MISRNRIGKFKHNLVSAAAFISAALFLFSACAPVNPLPTVVPLETELPTPELTAASTPTPIPTRPVYGPGTLVDYAAQSGDTLEAVARHFNTTVKEILEANPDLSAKVTTLTPGAPLKIPIYYEALWGNSFQILPDALFVNGPAQVGFDVSAFVDDQPGWLKNYSAFAGEETRRGGELVEYVARNYSISPRLLLALAEYQAGVLSQPLLPPNLDVYPLGYKHQYHKGFYLQLVWAANTLNDGYYKWRNGTLDTIYHSDGTIENPDPWQNAATVGLQYYFSQLMTIDDFKKAIYSDGLQKTYAKLFGDPWSVPNANIPGDLQQPALTLPFENGKTWAYTGGPHPAWGEAEPFAALDFAPPSVVGGCGISDEFVTAIADGQIVRSEPAVAMLDLDGDGDERTGWVILYLHLGLNDKVRPGVLVKTGDPIGHPSCEGGRTTGTHVHIARKYNGEWIQAEGALAFNLEGWIAGNGAEAYMGTLKKSGRTVEASTNSDFASHITAGRY